MTGRRVNDPDRTSGIVDDITHAPATGDLALPLLKVLSIVAMSRKIAM
jgi:hypothetical protein